MIGEDGMTMLTHRMYRFGTCRSPSHPTRGHNSVTAHESDVLCSARSRDPATFRRGYTPTSVLSVSANPYSVCPHSTSETRRLMTCRIVSISNNRLLSHLLKVELAKIGFAEPALTKLFASRTR